MTSASKRDFFTAKSKKSKKYKKLKEEKKGVTLRSYRPTSWFCFWSFALRAKFPK
jgi:hypothetical protein